MLDLILGFANFAYLIWGCDENVAFRNRVFGALEFRVWGLGLRGSRKFGVRGIGLKKFGVQGSGFTEVWGSGFRV